MSPTSIGEAHEALRLAEADPVRATSLAVAVARRAREGRDHGTASVAERALGVAALHLRDPDTAVRHLRTAVASGQRAGSPELVVDARIRLAFRARRPAPGAAGDEGRVPGPDPQRVAGRGGQPAAEPLGPADPVEVLHQPQPGGLRDLRGALTSTRSCTSMSDLPSMSPTSNEEAG